MTQTTLEPNCGHRRYGGECVECAWKRFQANPDLVCSPSPFKQIIDEGLDRAETQRRFWAGEKV
jgi:hypothetical protein